MRLTTAAACPARHRALPGLAAPHLGGAAQHLTSSDSARAMPATASTSPRNFLAVLAGTWANERRVSSSRSSIVLRLVSIWASARRDWLGSSSSAAMRSICASSAARWPRAGPPAALHARGDRRAAARRIRRPRRRPSGSERSSRRSAVMSERSSERSSGGEIVFASARLDERQLLELLLQPREALVASQRCRAALCTIRSIRWRCFPAMRRSSRSSCSTRSSRDGADRGVDAVEELVEPCRIDAAALEQLQAADDAFHLRLQRARIGPAMPPREAGEPLLDRLEPQRERACGRLAPSALRRSEISCKLPARRDRADRSMPRRARQAARAAAACRRDASSSGCACARDKCSVCSASWLRNLVELAVEQLDVAARAARVLRLDGLGERVDLVA